MTELTVTMGLSAAIITVVGDEPQVVAIRRAQHDLAAKGAAAAEESLPFGPFDPTLDRTLDLGLRRWIRSLSGLDVGYVEQLYTFGNRFRDPGELQGGPRVISVGYLGLLHQKALTGSGEAHWHSIYDYFPWEDWRKGRPGILNKVIFPALQAWAKEGDVAQQRRRQQRLFVSFGTGDSHYDHERMLDRFELLYDAGLVLEAHRDFHALHGRTDNLPISRNLKKMPSLEAIARQLGRPMALDHRRILAAAMMRVRGKLKYRPLVFELLPREFTLLQLQRVVEALAGMQLHKQNFRRLILGEKLVEETGAIETTGRGRPAALFRFREEAYYERPAPGVGLPQSKAAG